MLGVLCAGAAGAMEAGAAKVEITPELGTPLAGSYQRMGRGATAVHDPFYVRALYLEDGDTRVFLVSADLCVISPDLRQGVLERPLHGVPRENVILTATHTMNGPGGMVYSPAFRVFTGRYMPELVESMADRFAEAMAEAYGNRKRATIGFGTTEPQALSRNAVTKDGLVDAQLGVLRVNDSDGKPLAIVGNFGARCIGVNIPGPEMLTLSADVPGRFCEELEKLAEGSVAMFLQGACGDAEFGNPSGATGWARAETAGRALAQLAFETAQTIKSNDQPLAVSFANVEFPPTLADAYLPSAAPLATLEIGSLAMTFIPGAPGGAISKQLRSFCLTLGYEAQFTVGVANDYRFFFLSGPEFSAPGPESLLSFYGPGMGDWLLTNFSGLLSKGAAGEPAVQEDVPEVQAESGIQRIILKGTPHQLGYARGAAFRETLQAQFEERYVKPAVSGTLAPPEPFVASLPVCVRPYLALSNVTLPWMAMRSKTMLARLPEGQFEELAGLAAGADMPFDAAWLLQCAPLMETGDVRGGAPPESFGVVFAAVGLKAGADDILVGHNLDSPGPFVPVVYDVRPAQGLRYFLIGSPARCGGFSGINEEGVVVCVERNELLGSPAQSGPPVELVAAHILSKARNAWAALDMIETFPHLKGYHILLGDPVSGGNGQPPARVVTLDASPRLRAPTEGTLLGANPEAEQLSDAARDRYLRLAALIAEERNLNPSEIEEILLDSQTSVSETSGVFNSNTRYSAVFEPKARRMRVAAPGPDGSPGTYVRFEFESGAGSKGAARARETGGSVR
ncbi:MAG TPA: neutral/alkaline non-lysosomal ceramidase N-terminal domain-containing protein [Candidatus Hydrogenedentes bacterium]|nr:neutral/alkaline non-lysosomal ceramidase N-terminal domain-containing protein [Candidatus Hydrogenedentota bacterium]